MHEVQSQEQEPAWQEAQQVQEVQQQEVQAKEQGEEGLDKNICCGFLYITPNKPEASDKFI